MHSGLWAECNKVGDISIQYRALNRNFVDRRLIPHSITPKCLSCTSEVSSQFGSSLLKRSLECLDFCYVRKESNLYIIC